MKKVIENEKATMEDYLNVLPILCRFTDNELNKLYNLNCIKYSEIEESCICNKNILENVIISSESTVLSNFSIDRYASLIKIIKYGIRDKIKNEDKFKKLLHVIKRFIEYEINGEEEYFETAINDIKYCPDDYSENIIRSFINGCIVALKFYLMRK